MSIVSENTQSPAFFTRYQAAIDKALRAQLQGPENGLGLTHRYHLGWVDKYGEPVHAMQGKRLRPALALLGADAVEGDAKFALPIAIALELVHNFSLIHDDIEDRDQFRHHRPTMWVVWGDATAIVSGNSMLKIADQTTRALFKLGIAESMVLRTRRVITEAYLKMIEGQFMDIEFEDRTDVSVNDYLAMIERKTGALIETSLYLGALVADSQTSMRITSAEGLRRAGYEYGRLFQIRDDMLGVWGTDETGKPVCGDIYNKKKSLPAIHVLNVARGSASTRINAIYQKSELDANDVETVLEIMEEHGTYKFCSSMSARHSEKAALIIENLNLNPTVRDDFLELGDFLMQRSS